MKRALWQVAEISKYRSVVQEGIKDESEQEPPRLKCLLCFFGVIPRSIRHTWSSIYDNLVVPLKKEFDIDIFVYNLNVEGAKVDGRVLDQEDVKLIPFNFKNEDLQTDVDKVLNIKCKDRCQYREDYGAATERNAMRQLHSEKKVGDFLASHECEFACVCGPDYYLARKINMDHVRDSIATSTIYTSQVNDAEGYTNGFYFGKPGQLIKILNRYDEFQSSNHDYEWGVKRAFVEHSLQRKATDMVFWKIRASGNVSWQGGQRTSFLVPEEAARVRALYNTVKEQLSAKKD